MKLKRTAISIYTWYFTVVLAAALKALQKRERRNRHQVQLRWIKQ